MIEGATEYDKDQDDSGIAEVVPVGGELGDTDSLGAARLCESSLVWRSLEF